MAIKQKEILPFVTAWMELKGIMLSEISQSEKDKYHMISLMYVWNLMTKLNQQNRNRLTDSENRLTTASVGRVGGAGEKMRGLSSTH